MITKNILYVFLEGDTDRIFFDNILRNHFDNKYSEIRIITYQQLPIEKRLGLLRGIEESQHDYIYFKDLDNNLGCSECIRKIRDELPILRQEVIIIVIKEIESWFLAGMTELFCRKFRLHLKCFITDTLDKEYLQSVKPKKFISHREFLIEITNNYSIELAKRRNTSFNYFLDKFEIPAEIR